MRDLLVRFSGLLSELKRRRVFRVAAVYVVMAFAILQGADIIFPALHLPPWTMTLVVILALLGFPAAVALAWAFDLTPEGVVQTETAEEQAAADPGIRIASRAGGARTFAVPARRPRTVLLIALPVMLIASGGISWFVLRGDEALPRGEALLTTLDGLIDSERYTQAFALAQRASALGETLPDSLWLRAADRLTIVSNPQGARVLAQSISDGAETPGVEWRELGRTPLHGFAVPRGEYLLRLELEGHATVERIASSTSGRARMLGRIGGGEVMLNVLLPPASRLPGDVVFVPGGVYALVSRDLQGQSAPLEDFFLDRFEVSNAAFAEFVDAGGYLRAEYWTELQEARGVGAAAARRSLTDRTGLAGPRGWSGQRPPSGGEKLPVTGVSWFEAAAYCRFRGARLPTVFEWEKAARDGQIVRSEGIFMPWGYLGPQGMGAKRANFGGEGPVPIDTYPFGISPYGAYGMAGNAKEWLANATENGRAVTGGSWADPIYVFPEVGSLDPLGSWETVGFRCARHVEPNRAAHADQGSQPLRVATRTPEYRPVDDASYPLLLAHYAYDRRPLNAQVLQRLEAPGWTRERIVYEGPGGARVVAYLYVPKSGRRPHQTLVFVPSSASFFGSSVTYQAEWLLGPIIRSGRALFVVVMEGMTEREWPTGYEPPAPSSVAFRDQMVRHATELRMGLDYLETRSDVDMRALAYVGLSWGAGSRLLFAALDERFRAVALIGGGIDERVRPTLPEASNVNFAPRIRAPKLLLNGREDEEHPWRTRALPLWNLLTEPKELVLIEGAGHVPPLEARVPALREWLDRTLGPVSD